LRYFSRRSPSLGLSDISPLLALFLCAQVYMHILVIDLGDAETARARLPGPF
jgi:uncharacterized protein YggT (Ycf19 family)